MAQVGAAYLYLFIAVINCLLFGYILFNVNKRFLAKEIAVVSFLILEWTLSVAVRSIATNPDTAIFFHELKFAGAAFIPVALLFFSMKHSGLGKVLTIKHGVLLALIPALTAVLAVTNDWHHLFRLGFEIIYQPDGAFYIKAHSNVWFYVHSLYTYALVLASLYILALRYSRLPAVYRGQTGVFIAGAALPFLANLVDFSGAVRSLDLTVVAFTVTGAVYVWGVFFYGERDLAPLARIKIVEELPNPIFIYDLNDNLIDTNQAAGKLVEGGVEKLLGTNRQNVMASLMIKQYRGENEDYFFCELDGGKKYFTLNSEYVTEKDGKIIGRVEVLNEVTSLEKVIQEFERIAITDRLTGFFNRHFFEETMKVLEGRNTVPIGIIIGDINGLKRVNDTLGHASGDELIGRASSAIRGAVRTEDIVARIGGDEFAILLPGMDEDGLKKVMERVNQKCQELSDQDINVSISMGYAIKKSENQTLEEVLREADEAMYRAKQQRQT